MESTSKTKHRKQSSSSSNGNNETSNPTGIVKSVVTKERRSSSKTKKERKAKPSVQFMVHEKEQTKVANAANAANINPEEGSSPQDDPKNPSKLDHMAHRLPGLKANVRNWDMKRWTFSRLFTKNLIVPIFQRRYCWTSEQIVAWWLDVSGGSTRLGLLGDGTHNCGRVIFKYDAQGNILVVDGQQRSTTMQLLLASLRDAWNCDEGDINEVDSLIFDNPPEFYEWCNKWAIMVAAKVKANPENVEQTVAEEWISLFVEGGLLPFQVRLTPTYPDRMTFFRLIAFKSCCIALQDALSDSTIESTNIAQIMENCNTSLIQENKQYFAKAYFDKMVPTAKQDQLLDWATNRTSIMTCTVLTDINLAQLFLHLQQKTLFGMGALLHNPTPGIHFDAIDLVRNLLLASSIEDPKQEELYLELWVQHFETPGCRLTDEHLVQFLKKNKTKHVGTFEQYWTKILSTAPQKVKLAFGKDSGIMLYARFLSFVESAEIEHSGQHQTITNETSKKVLHKLRMIMS